MANFCENCGTKLTPGVAFCPECGAKIEQSAAAAQPRQAQPQQAQPVNQRPVYNYAAPKQAQQAQQQYQPQQPQQQYQQPQQQYQQQYRQPQQPQYQYQQTQSGQSGTPRRKNSFVILTVFLAVILAIEGVIACFWYPGFLRTGGSGSSNDITGKYDGTSTMSKSLSDADYNIDYTDKEIADAPKTEMKVSADNTSASSGDFSVDFGAFNGMEDDTFTLRELPVHDFEKDGYSVQGYDFSLASGKHDFPDEVCIKVPRTEEDGDLVQFMSKNPDTGENERLYHEISDDGKSFLVYTTHFSQGVKVTKGEFGEKLKQDITTMDVSDPLTRDALSAFFYTYDDLKDPLLMTNVNYCRDDLWNKVNNSTYLPLARDMTEAMVKASEGSTEVTKSSSINSDMSGILFYDNETARQTIANVDAVNNGATLALETVKGLSSGKVAEGCKVAGEFCSQVSVVTTVAGFYFNTAKAIKEVRDGKYDDMEAAAWGHWSDNLGTAVGVVGLAGAAAASTPVTVICAIGGLGLYCYSKATETPYDDLDQTEINYRSYFNYYTPAKGVLGTKGYLAMNFFYYDEPDDAKGMGYGNIRRLTCLDDKQNSVLKKYLSSHYVQGSISGEDPRSTASEPDEKWLTVLEGIYEATKDKPELLNTAVLEFYKNYTEACSPYLKDKDGNKIKTISEADYLSFSRDAMEKRGASREAARLPTEEEMKAYTERMYKEMLKYHSPIFQQFAEYLSHQAELEVDKMIETELVPLLNTPMLFSVEDTSLKAGETFEKSVYNVEPSEYQEKTGDDYLFMGKYKDVRQYKIPSMEFCIHDGSGYSEVGPPRFYPSMGEYTGWRNRTATIVRQVSEREYFPVTENFWPEWIGNNTVFVCTYYHYLMMGAPNSMSFYDMKDDVRYSDDFVIPKPDEKGRISINIKIQGVEESTEPRNKTGLEAYLGTWYGSYTNSDGDNRNVRLEVKKDNATGDLEFSLYKGSEKHDKVDELASWCSIDAKDLKSKSLKNTSCEYDGTTLTLGVNGNKYDRAKLTIQGDTVSVTQTSYRWDDDIWDTVDYDYNYKLTKVSDTAK